MITKNNYVLSKENILHPTPHRQEDPRSPIKIKAKIKESGIATTGLTHEDIVDLISNNSDPLLEILTEAHAAINGHPIETLDSLYTRLDAVQNSGSSVIIVFKRWSAERDRVYDYVERSIAIEDLQFVGPSSLKHVASRN